MQFRSRLAKASTMNRGVVGWCSKTLLHHLRCISIKKMTQFVDGKNDLTVVRHGWPKSATIGFESWSSTNPHASAAISACTMCGCDFHRPLGQSDFKAHICNSTWRLNLNARYSSCQSLCRTQGVADFPTSSARSTEPQSTRDYLEAGIKELCCQMQVSSN